jgi:hypothetical protein
MAETRVPPEQEEIESKKAMLKEEYTTWNLEAGVEVSRSEV